MTVTDTGEAGLIAARDRDEMDMTTRAGEPTGLLKWGQAGTYDAPDDRQVITAVLDNAIGGVVRPPALTPGAGLLLNIGPGWLAVASCEDGTNAVIGSRLNHQVTLNPGPATGSRNDLLWADTDPDAATWALHVIPESDMPGRAGLPLARITVPAGANLASQMTISGAVHSLSPKVDTDTRDNHGLASYADLTPRYPFGVYGMRRDSMFRLTASGSADVGGSTGYMRFLCGGCALELNPASIGLSMSARLCHWEAEAVTVFGYRFAQGVANTRLAVTLTRDAVVASPSTSIRAVHYAGSVQFGAGPWLSLMLQMLWTSAAANANISCSASAFEQVAKPW